MFKLSKEGKKYYNSLSVEEILSLHKFEGLAFECNDGAIEVIYLDGRKRSSKYAN